jgi:hypothetical protein
MTKTSTFNKGMTIRGLAGPFVVMAQNFAPGTTAADIESAMTPVGGIVSSCRVVKDHPLVIAEIVFESKEGADNVIATFNNQTVRTNVLSWRNLKLTSPGRRPRPQRVRQSRQHSLHTRRPDPDGPRIRQRHGSGRLLRL